MLCVPLIDSWNCALRRMRRSKRQEVLETNADLERAAKEEKACPAAINLTAINLTAINLTAEAAKEAREAVTKVLVAKEDRVTAVA